MGKLLALLFTIIVMATFVGLDYFLARKTQHGAPYSLGDHFTQRTSGVTDIFYPPQVVDILPAAPAGWTVRPTEEGDQAIVTGIEPPVLTESEKATILGRETSRRLALSGTKEESLTYVGGPDMVVMQIALIPVGTVNRLGDAHMDVMFEMARDAGPAPAFASIHGVQFLKYDQDPEGNATRLKARIGRQIYVTVQSNAEDQRTFDLIKGLKIDILKKITADQIIMGLGDGGAVLAAPEQPAAP